MKILNKFLAALLTVILLLSANFTIVLAAAEDGIGTEASPYLIYTAEDLQNINDDVTAHYKLAADIDLQEMDFTPIGNTDTGAFTGSFDGEGYTISNLNVFAGKYVGLFGYNEGTIKNVTLTDVYVYGTRYVGAVVAYNEENAVIENCSVLSGEVESDGGLNNVSAGGICGTNYGVISGEFSNGADLTVNNTEVAYAAGICAHNVGEFSGVFANTGDVYANCTNDDAYAGGILAVTSSDVEITATNSGNISSSSCAGGIGAYFSQPSKFTDCSNLGHIEGIQNSNLKYPYYLGGIGGCFVQLAEFENCYNTGNVKVILTGELTRRLYLAGIGGRFCAASSFLNCHNTGDIYGQSDSLYDFWGNGDYGDSSYCGGISGYATHHSEFITCSNTGSVGSRTWSSFVGGLNGYLESQSYISLENCSNTGEITADGEEGAAYSAGLLGFIENLAKIKNCYNTGIVKSYADTTAISCGLIGRGSAIFENCFNSGPLIVRGDSTYAYGLCSGNTGNIFAENCYNLGLVRIYGSYYTPKSGNDLPQDAIRINCYTVNYLAEKIEGTNCYSSVLFIYENAKSEAGDNILTAAEMRDKNSFEGWDFDTVWDINPTINSGLPYLREAYNPLSLNVITHTMLLGEKLQLVAYKNGEPCDDVKWTSSQENTINQKGVFSPINTDTAIIITAEDSEGNTVSAFVRVMTPNTSVSYSDFSLAINSQGSCYYVAFGQSSTNDYLINVVSSNPDVLRIDKFDYTGFYCSSLFTGKATITFETAQGLVGSCVCTVTNVAKSIQLNSSYVTIAKDSTYQLTATPNPNPTSSKVTWSSSDNTVATVDEYGTVYAVNKGSATITCLTDNGLSATCTINVTIPATEISFDEPEVTIYVGDTKELTFTVTPADATDGISSIKTSNTSYLPIQTWNSCSCTVKGVSTGTQTITVKMSNGLTATCKVKVLPVPVVVTSVSLNATSRAMLVGEKYKLNATIYPSNSTDKSVEWTSTDETVATVSDTGYITAVGAGETVITASASNGVVAHCTVTVTDPANNKLPIIYIPDTIVTDGEYFDIPIMLENNPGINKAVFSVQYDVSKVEPISVTNGEIFDYTTATTNKDESKVNLYFVADTDKYANGVLATLRFKILVPDAGDAEFKLCYTPNDFISSTQEKVEFETEDGVAVIACSHNNTEIRNAVKNSCTANGYTGDKYCLDCSKIVVEGAVILSTGHEWNDWHTTVEPTFTTDGNTARTCATCGETENEVIEKLTNAKVTDSFIYGLSCGLDVQEFENQFNSDYVNINIEPSFGTTVGTGSTVTATYANGTSDTLTVVIFGDVNGDGWYDGEDAVLVNMIVVGMLSEDNCSQALCIAADCNRDGVINKTDVDLLMGAGVKKNDIDQSIPHEELAVNSSFIEYSSLINQSTELIIDSENQTTESESTPESSDSKISFDSTEKPVQEITTENIWINTFWGIFKKIFSFILQLFTLV